MALFFEREGEGRGMEGRRRSPPRTQAYEIRGKRPQGRLHGQKLAQGTRNSRPTGLKPASSHTRRGVVMDVLSLEEPLLSGNLQSTVARMQYGVAPFTGNGDANLPQRLLLIVLLVLLLMV